MKYILNAQGKKQAYRHGENMLYLIDALPAHEATAPACDKRRLSRGGYPRLPQHGANQIRLLAN